MSEALQQEQLLYDVEARLQICRANLHDLATMGAVITSIHELQTVLSVVMEMSIRLVNGEVGIILLYEEEELSHKISWGVSDDFVKSLIYQDGMDIASYCYKIKETIILSDLGVRNEDGNSIDSIICSPIKTSEKCLGVVVIINKATGESYTDEDKEILEVLLSFVAVAIENSNLIKEKLLKQKIDQEIAIAKQIQETILPDNIDILTGLEIGAVYYPAREVSGDFYDVIKIDDNNAIVIMGDVSNKGIPAAMVMSAAAGIIKSTVALNPNIEISSLASIVNDTLCEHIIKDRDMFITLFFSKFDLKNHKLTFCNAGHVPGLFWNNSEQRIKELSEGGTIIGQFQGIKFKQGECSLEKGDRLFLFTDGLTEAEDAEGRLFGRERAEQVFSAEIGLSPNEFCAKVKEWVDRYAEGAAEDTIDDFTIMQVKVN